MSMRKGSISMTGLIVILIVIVVAVGVLIYLDSIGKLGAPESVVATNQADTPPETQETVEFISYSSPDGIYQLQIPDFWRGEERAGASIFYSYPASEQPAQYMKIEVAKQPNPKRLTALDWMTEQKLDVSQAQPAVLNPAQGLALIEDNSQSNPNDISVKLYVPVDEQMYIVTAQSEGDIRDVAVQFFNAILNSWQWVQAVEPVEKVQAAATAPEAGTPGTQTPESVTDDTEESDAQQTTDTEPIADDEEINP
ncbi:MAG: hypothetical protein NUV82_03265 [Candidatus Komeilibacteria bacterium]|nr:hypothetical protein [Candidatus Komeilibacteria bacterium]